MKLDPEFLMQEVGDDSVLVPVGAAGQRFKGVIRLNSTASFIVEHLKDGATRDELIAALGEEYEGDAEMFGKSVDATIASLREAGAIID